MFQFSYRMFLLSWALEISSLASHICNRRTKWRTKNNLIAKGIIEFQILEMPIRAKPSERNARGMHSLLSNYWRWRHSRRYHQTICCCLLGSFGNAQMAGAIESVEIITTANPGMKEKKIKLNKCIPEPEQIPFEHN